MTAYHDNPLSIGEIQARLVKAITSYGHPAPTKELSLDGTFNRFGPKKVCWCVANLLSNGHVSASFGDWSTGLSATFRSWENGHAVDPNEAQRLLDELARRQKIAEEADRRNKAVTAKREAEIWGFLPETGNSEYLTRKGVGAHGIRYGADQYGKFIAVPMHTASGKFTAFQRIYDDGRKHFPFRGEKKGAFHLIGTITTDGVLYLAEGYATGATVHEATGKPVAVCLDAGNFKAVADALKEVHPGIQFIVAADNDQWKAEKLDNAGKPIGNTGIKAAYAMSRAHPGTKIVIPNFDNLKFDVIDYEGPTDFNDLAALAGIDAAKRQLEKAFEPKSKDTPPLEETADKSPISLILNKYGEPRTIIANVIEVLAKDARWANVVGYNEFSGYAVLLKRPPYDCGQGEWKIRKITDMDASLTAAWLQQNYHLHAPSALADEGLQVVAMDNKFHPVREYLDSLTWDGISRIDTWAIDYFGVQESAYVKAVSSKYFIQAVARIYSPGCKADSVLVLEGTQGIGKSTFFRVLAGDEYFTDTLPDMHSKDAMLHMAGKWIGELAELAALARSEVEAVKTFAAATQDTFRPPYGRRPITVPRQCVFVATTNADGYLKDNTGNRRFWPVKALVACDIRAVIANRNQLWAEAVHRFKHGEAWHLPPEIEEMAAEQQLSRVEVDEWEPKILSYLACRSFVESITSTELLVDALNIPEPKDWTQMASKRIASILRKNGWERKTMRIDGEPRKCFVRIKKPTPPVTPPNGGGSPTPGHRANENTATNTASTEGFQAKSCDVTPIASIVTPVSTGRVTENLNGINAVTSVTPVTSNMIGINIIGKGIPPIPYIPPIGTTHTTYYIGSKENISNTGNSGNNDPIPVGNQSFERYPAATKTGNITPLGGVTANLGTPTVQAKTSGTPPANSLHTRFVFHLNAGRVRQQEYTTETPITIEMATVAGRKMHGATFAYAEAIQ